MTEEKPAPGSLLPPELATAQAQAGFTLETLPAGAAGYTFNEVMVDAASQIVCLHYKPSDPYSQTELYLLQGPMTASLQPRRYPGLPPETETVPLGGVSEPAVLTSGVLPPANACADNTEWPRYILAWTFQDRQYLLYGSVDVPAGGPGLTRLEMLQLAESLTGVTTHPAGELNPDFLRSVADAETLAGFDIREPTYLPEGVSFLYGTYQAEPAPFVTLYYKLIHPEYGDRGRFFQITQTPLGQGSPSALTCGEPPSPNCELLDIGDMSVIHQQQPEGPESLDWHRDGFAFSLFRMAGEPGQEYTNELVNIVESMK
jgi:hypothetical protein